MHAYTLPGLQEVEESKATSMSAEELMDLLKADAGSNDVPQSGVADDQARFVTSVAISSGVPRESLIMLPCEASYCNPVFKLRCSQ